MGLSFLDPTSGYRKLAVALGVLLLIIVAGLGCGWWSYGQGFEKAEALGKAALKTREAEYATASANATEESRQRSEILALRGNDLASKLIVTRRELDKARADITRRITDVAQTVPAACVFGPDFVRWWNVAAGFCADASSEASDPGGAAGRPGEAGAAGAGVRQNKPVGLEDLMTHHRDLAAYSRELEATSAARLRLLEAWTQ